MKLLYTLLLLTVTTSLFAQQVVDMPRLQADNQPRAKFKNKIVQDRNTPFSRWINYAALVYDDGSSDAYYRHYVFPDSTVVVEYTDGYGPVWKHSMGQVLDPTAPYFQLDSFEVLPLTPYMSYTVDSLVIPYRYWRPQTGAPDTVRIEYYVGNKVILQADPGWTSGASYATVQYDTVDFSGDNFTQQFDVILGDADTAMAAAGYMFLPVEITANADQVFAFTATYFPGNPYNFGDTIDKYTTATVTNPINAFVMYDVFDADLTLEPGFYNNELLAITSIRYNNNAQGWNGHYIPGTAYATGFFNADAIFRITYDLDALSVNDINKNELATYPNPVTDALRFYGDINGETNITITNAIGQTVMSTNRDVNNGQLESIDVQKLTPGIYVIRIMNNGTATTARFVKQ